MANCETLFDLKRLTEHVDATEGSATWRERPVIGISCNFADGCSTLRDLYSNAVINAGGVPLLIPVTTDREVLAAAVDRIDGLLLTGGGDILALYAGEDPEPGLKGVDPMRDTYDFMLLKTAADRVMPIMGICRGHQVINIFFGGKNYQDISNIEGVMQHSQQSDKMQVSHLVTLTPGTVLRKLLGKDSLAVNSFHHQAVREVAPGFTPTACSADGINEGMEAMPVREIFSVQWHPEGLVAANDEMMPLFSYLVRQAALFHRAKRFHETHLTLDSHCDTPMKFGPGVNIGLKNPNLLVDLRKMEEGMLDSVIMVAFLRQRERDEEALRAVTEQTFEILNEIKRQISLNSTSVGEARTPEDVYRLKSEGKRAIFLGIENGYAIGSDIENIRRFKEMGVVYITLCHNGDNDICDSCKGESEHCGVSDFGERVIREMNRLGIMVDVSHAADQTVRDALEISATPIIASHSSARALCNHPRNLPDELIEAIAERGGVVQVTIYDEFVKEGGGALLQDFIAHINYVANLAGIDHVGIGTDFDGDGGIAGCNAANELIAITMALYKEGYSDEEIAKIWGGNILRVMSEVQKYGE